MIVAACQHNRFKKHGKDRNGVQRYRCLDCGKTVIEPQAKPLGESRLPMDRAVMCLKMILEGMSILRHVASDRHR